MFLKYIHYEVDMQDVDQELLTNSSSTLSRLSKIKIPPQWIQCDLRTFDMTILGKFSVIMAGKKTFEIKPIYNKFN